MKRKNSGSTFDSWLRDESIYEEATVVAIKRVLTRQIEAAMKDQAVLKRDAWRQAARRSIGCSTRVTAPSR